MDGYCERLGPGLAAEPLNAITNVAFLLAAAILLIGRPRSRILPVLLGVIGLCSLAFHTFATPATAALDSLSILVFILVALVLLAHHAYGVRRKLAWLAAPAFLVFFAAVNLALGMVVGGYLPPLLVLVALAVALRSRLLEAAAALFTISLTLRTLDEPLCDRLPIGTHWAWHCLNAVVLSLVALTVERHVARRGMIRT